MMRLVVVDHDHDHDDVAVTSYFTANKIEDSQYQTDFTFHQS